MKINPMHCSRAKLLAGIGVTMMTIVAARADYQSTIIADHPLAYYPLDLTVDVNGVATDLSGNDNNGTYVSIYPGMNLVSGPSPYITNAVSFDGSSSWVDLGKGNNPGLLNFGGAITMEAWVQPSSASMFGNILAKGYDSANNYAEVTLRANGSYGGYYGGSSGGVTGGTQTANWTHVVCVNDGTNWLMFVNGVLVQQSGNTVGAMNLSYPWAIGTGTLDGSSRYFQGSISQVALYNYALTPLQVSAHYFVGNYGVTNPVPKVLSSPLPRTLYVGGTARFSVSGDSFSTLSYQWYKGSTLLTGQTNSTLVLTNVQSTDAANYSVALINAAGSTKSASAALTVIKPSAYGTAVIADKPLAFYPLNETSGDAVLECVNGFNGTYKNSPQLGVAGPSSYITAGVNFDGATQIADLGNPATLNIAGNVTVEAWVQASDTPAPSSLGYIVAHGLGASSWREVDLKALPSDGFYIGEWKPWAGYGATAPYQSGDLGSNLWVHLVGTFDGAKWNLYRNGVLMASGTDTDGAITVDDSPWAIGGSGTGGRFFQGAVSQVAIYDHALSKDQIQNHYFFGQFGKSPSNTPPVITAQPMAQTCSPNTAMSFNVGVLSALPVTYQWYKNSVLVKDQTNSAFALTSVQPSDAASYYVIITSSAGSTKSASVTLAVSEGASLEWAASNNNGVWDTSTANWVNFANGRQVAFSSYDKVTFDDVSGEPTIISLDTVVTPAAITNNSSDNNFLIAGAGSIAGTGSLVKKGTSKLTIATVNSFTGPITVQDGTLQVGVSGALGSSTQGTVMVTNTGVLDINGINIGPKPILVSGAGAGSGAIVNSAGDIYSWAPNITLTGNTMFGGNRWDLAGGSIVGTGGNPYNLTLSGSYRELNGVAFDSKLADIDVQCTIGLKNLSSLGDPARRLIIEPGAEVDYWSGNGPAKIFHVMSSATVKYLSGNTFDNGFVFEDGSTFVMIWGSRTFNGPVTLNGVVNMLIGDGTCTFTNVISGPGGLYWVNYNNTLLFSASNTYSGMTYIGDGRTLSLAGNGSIFASSPIVFGGTAGDSTRIDVSGRTDKTFTLANGQTLNGSGKVQGDVVVANGATLAPGTNGVLGIISASGSVMLGGTTQIRLNTGTNDQIVAGTSITYGGTLSLTDLSGTLSAGDSFQIFNAANYAGAFSSIVPATPGQGLAWDKSQLQSGKLGVIVAGSQPPVVDNVKLSSGNLVLSGSNAMPNSSYNVLTSTNVAAPLSSWTVVGTIKSDANGAFGCTNSVDSKLSQQFFLIKLP